MAIAASTAIPQKAEIKERAARGRRSPLRRLLDAVEQANMRKAEREIARYLGGPGAKFTDEAEREIARRYLDDPAT